MTWFISRKLKRFFGKLVTPDWLGTLIGILALLTSIYSGWASRDYIYRNARPYLFINEMFATSSPRLGLVVSNVGQRLGVIDKFSLSLDDVPLKGDWRAQWEEFRTKTDVRNWTNVGALPMGVTVPPNPSGIAEILIIVDESQFSQEDPAEWKKRGQDLRAVVQRLTISIEYHSVYGEHFLVEKRGFNSQQFRRRTWFTGFTDWQP